MATRLLTGLLLAFVAQAGPTAGPSQADKELPGIWQEIARVEEGNFKNVEKMDLHVVLTETTFVFTAKGILINKGTYSLDTSKSPKHIDLKITESPNPENKGQTYAAIYEVKDGVLIVCGFVKGKEGRPPEFVSSKGSKTSLLILKQVKK